MEPPISCKVSSLEEVTELISDHGEIQGVRVHIQRKVESICQGKEMAVLLRAMMKGGKRWIVPHIDALEKLKPIHANLSAADSVIDDLIRRTHPTTARARRHRRQAGVHVGSPIRVPSLTAASGRRRKDRAGSPATASRHSVARRRPASPAPIPFRVAKKLRHAGKLLGGACLYVVQELGEDIIKIASKLTRVNKDEDIASTHAALIALKRKLNKTWESEVRLKDLKVEFA